MIDELKAAQAFTSEEPRRSWKGLPLHELLRMRDEITEALPQGTLSSLDMEAELVLQYLATRALQSDVMDDESIPPSQKAQVANAVSACLSKLATLQAEVYSSERHKRIEGALIRSLALLPEEAASEFLGEYEKVLTGL